MWELMLPKASKLPLNSRSLSITLINLFPKIYFMEDRRDDWMILKDCVIISKPGL